MSSLDDPIVKALTAARVSLLFNAPFFGNLATRMQLVQADGWCKTAATDGRNFYYNREFIKSLTPEQVLFLFGHEVLHAVYDHLGRKGFRDPKIWNMANDYIVNYTLVKSNIGKMPKHGLYDERYTDDMTSEEVYKELLKNSVQVQMTLDEHLTLDGSDPDDSGGNKRVTVTVMGDCNGPPKLTEEDRQKIRNQLKADIINTAHAVGAGKIPAGVRRLIDAFTNPRMDWRALLELHVQSQIKDDFTFQRPSRRSWVGDQTIILPGQDFKKRPELVAFIDMSGSITDDMVRDFLSEIKGIMETYEDFWILLATFDTRIYNPTIFTPENIDDLMTYSTQGGGGTDFMCMYEFMQAPDSVGFGDEFPDQIVPQRMVVFTDGLPFSEWGIEDYCDVLWIIHGNARIEAPFGVTVPYTLQDTE
jgi:predicted metal-dependent peptidase